ncbi:MAG: ABC transporter ATP-binding protein [Ruminococcaceae bacterium]|nr:ABC transporter ATP-binding protein [Oscillospiraceae bacterium]
MQDDILLDVQDLSVVFPTQRGVVRAVNRVNFDVCKGEVMGVVGESGSGKSTVAYSVMRLLKKPGKIDGGSLVFDGTDILQLKARELERFRGSRISMIFQDPMQCLDPVFTIGKQLIETIKAHENVTTAQARAASVEMLKNVGIHDAENMMSRYPFELSGGMRQRVMIAIALLCRPELLIADEPTTALDVTIQDQILQLLKKMKDDMGMSVLFITHNFGIVAELCDRVTVMYGGRVMERGTVDDVFYNTAHPYTLGLMRAIPKADLLTNERLTAIEGTAVDPMNPPTGCVFHPRCPYCTEACKAAAPPETDLSDGHFVSCWRFSEVRRHD